MCRVYLKYKDYLLILAKGLLGEQAEAEDVVQDVFVTFARLAKDFQLTGSLRGYLATCVSNLARDRMRVRKRRPETLDSVGPIASGSDDPGRHTAKAEDLMRLRQAMRQIPYEQREAVILHLKGGMKFRQIARLQGVSLSTAHGRYRYGLDRLRSLLNSEVEK